MARRGSRDIACAVRYGAQTWVDMQARLEACVCRMAATGHRASSLIVKQRKIDTAGGDEWRQKRKLRSDHRG